MVRMDAESREAAVLQGLHPVESTPFIVVIHAMESRCTLTNSAALLFLEAKGEPTL